MASSSLIAGRYKRIRLLGEGGMGTVWLVEDRLKGGAAVALKTEKLDEASREAVAALKREFRVLSRLDHPNLARVFDFGTLRDESGSRLYFTSELVDGAPLMKATEGADWQTVYSLAAELLRALDYLHARGIFHRDVKPGNVLVTAAGALKLVDFGIVAPAHVVEGRTLRGTPAYLAPEMIRGEPPDARTDLYALGVTLFQVATRKFPLEAPSNREMLVKQLHEVPPPATAVRPDVPPAFSAFLERLLAKEPAARFATAARALAALSAIAGREWTADPAEGTSMRAARMVGRERETARLREHVEARLAGPRDPAARPAEHAPPAIAVTGPFGAGKSRLLGELKVRLQLADVPVLSAEAGAGWDPLAPWASLVREAAATIAPDELREKWSRELGVLVPSLRADSLADLAEEPLVLHRLPAPAASSFLAECAAVRPFAMLLDELDQAGPALLDQLGAFLRQLSLTTPAPRIALAVACETGSAAAAAVRDWIAAGLATGIELDDLDAAETAQLAASILGATSIPADGAKSLHAASHGNPFVLGEILSALAGKVKRLPGGEIHLPKTPAEPPKRLKTLLERRLAGVGGRARSLLDALAVLGAPASLAAIQAMDVSLDDDEGFAALDELVARGLAARDGSGRFVLRPPILCEVVRGELSAKEAKRLHRLAAAHLEAGPDADSRAADLARHFAGCGDDAGEARWSRIAGFRLKRLYAGEEALRLLARAAELAPDAAVELAAAEVERLLGRLDDARKRLDRALSMRPSSELEVPILLLQARIALAGGAAERAWELAENARAAAPQGSAAALRVAAAHAELLLEQGKAEDAARIVRDSAASLGDDDALAPRSREAAADLLLAGGLAELAARGAAAAEPLVTRASRLFAMAGDRRGEVRSRHALGRIQFQRGRSAEALELFRGAVRGFLEVGDLAACGIAQMNLGVVLHGASDYVAAIEAYEDALAMLDPGGSARDRAMVGCNLGNLLGLLGALEPARAHLERSLAIARGAGLAFVEGYASLLLGVIALAEGGRDEAEASLRSARAILLGAGNRRQACTAAAQLAEALRESRRFDEASALLVEAESEARRVDSPDVLARCLDGRARVEIDRPGGDLALADELLAECGRLAELAGDREVRGEVEATAARLHARRGDVATAVKILEELDRGREEQRARLPPEWQATFFRERERRLAREELTKLYGARVPPTPRSTTMATVAPPTRPPADPTATGASLSPWTPDALRQLLEVVRAMNARRGIDELLAHILDASIALTGAERGLLLEAEGGAFPARLARGADGAALPTESFRVSRTLAEQVARTGAGTVIAELASDPRFRSVASIAAIEATSVLAVPLRGRSGAAGAVWLETRGRAGAFGARELELAQTFADQAGIALENARLLEDASRRAAELGRAKAKNEELVKRLSAEVHETSRNLDALREELERTRVEYVARHDYKNLVGSSREMREVFRLLDRITDTEVTVLIQGESGTGKELVARALHVNGPRTKGPFVAENCGAVPEGLLESVLFGHVKGAFTGAAGDRKGLFELANGGTLFLDEVGEMPPSMQVKLLRALQESEVRRIGAAAPVKVDVRVVAATNRDLREEVAAKRFREDLFYRLNVVRVSLPPLRERTGDVPLLARHFLARFQGQLGKGPASISDAAMAKLARHSWPGNIRELENVLKSAYLLSTGKEIAPGDLALAAPAAEPPALRLLSGAKIGEMEERLIREAMEKAAGRVAAAAELLGIPERTLYHKLARLGLKRKKR